MERLPNSFDSVSAILEASYRYAATPENPDLLFDLAEIVSGAGLDTSDTTALAMVERHFELAAALAAQIGPGSLGSEPVADALVLLDGRRRVKAAGAQARRLIDLVAEPGSHDSGLVLRDEHVQAQFSAALRRIASGEASNATLRLRNHSDETVCFGHLTPDPGDDGFRLHLIAPVTELGLDSAMLADLGITPAELRLLERFQDGRSLREAATDLGISYHTARNHLRSIFDKFGVNRQSELVRYLTMIASVAAHTPAVPQARPARFGLEAAIAVYRAPRTLALKNGRTLAYHRYGPTDGQPIAMVNGAVTSFLISEPMWKRLYERGIQLIALHRPGYGGSSAVSGLNFEIMRADGAAFAQAIAEDTGASRIPLIGYSASSSLALSVAEGFGDRAGPLGLIAPRFELAPDPGEGGRFSTRFFRDSMSAPWAMEFGLAVFRTRLSDLVVGRFLDRIFEGSRVDQTYLTAHPELRTVLIEAAKLALESPARVILQEAQLMRIGRDPHQHSLTRPLIGWHGDCDGINPLAQDVPHSVFDRFEVIEGGGHLLFATHFDRIIDDVLAAL